MFSFLKYFGISEENDIFDFTSWHQFSESQPGWKLTIFIRLACHIYWVQKSCNTTNFLHNSSLSKKAQLQENCVNLIIWRLTKAECSLTCSSTVAEKNWHFDHVPYLGIPKYFRFWLYNSYSMSPSSIWSDKITNERVARVGYNHFISNKGEWNNCFSKFSNRVLPPIFISTILQSGKFLNLAHYFPYDVKLRLLAHSRSFLANQKARKAIVGAENLLNKDRSSSICKV